jgi:superfamily II DNA or RNA helicase
MQALFDTIRSECSTRVWSRGVELARADAVVGRRDETSEVVLQVSTRGGMISPTVTLYPGDEDWECECATSEAVCEHVAAAVIALRKSRREGGALPKPVLASGHLRYRFSRFEGGLAFQRCVVVDGREEPLRSTLSAVASGRIDGPSFTATSADLDVERALGAKRRGPMDRAAMRRLIDPLSRCEDVRLEEMSIQVSDEPAGLHGLLVDAEGGFTLSLRQDPSVTERFNNDAVLCGDVLRIVGPSKMTGRELADLPTGRFFSHDRVAELVTEVLPSLEERIPVAIQTRKLPKTARERPRIAIDVKENRNQLSVLATLVYGDPATARVDGNRLVHLRGTIPIRNENLEKSELRRLREELGLVPGRRLNLGPEQAIEFGRRLSSWRGEVQGNAHESFTLTTPLEPHLEIDGETLNVSFESPLPAGDYLDVAGDEGHGEGGQGAPRDPSDRFAAPDAVLRAWQEGTSLVRLRGGGLAALPEDWLERYGHRIADLLAARDASGRVATHSLPDLARLCDDLDYPTPPSLERLAPLFEDFEGIPKAALPEDLRGELRDYQHKGVDWLYFLRSIGLGALLADDMGLGKTVQALCALEGRCLVVAPTSLIHNWESETKRFRPGLAVNTYHGPGRQLDPDADVTLTSYALLRLDTDTLAAVDWNVVVIDEAQNIKNPQSQVAQAACALRANFRIALTGTPVENRLDELWSQLHFLNRGLLGGRRDFRDRYARPIVDGDVEMGARLRERLRPFVLRRLKRDVAPELPPRTEVVLRFDLSSEEREVYRAVEAATVRPVVERLRSGGSVIAALEALLRLRQAACHSGLVPGQEADQSSKVSLLVERAVQAVEDGHKALIFSQWTSFLDKVEPHLEGAGIAFERLDGATRERGAVVDRFQDANGAPVMLVSLKAGGTGLNLTAADHIFLLDPWWNPAVEDQAADRAHRIGQTRPVIVHRLIASDTVEERILELHARKRALSEVVLGGGGQAEGLRRQDLLALLG